eukprot:8065180-Ditylum_brightwellii.AAC.1
MKPSMPITRVDKPENPNKGPHIILPYDDDKMPTYDPSASNNGEQLVPCTIKCNEPTYQYQTRICKHQMNHVAIINYSHKELMDAIKVHWKEQEKKDYHIACVVIDEETREEMEY